MKKAYECPFCNTTMSLHEDTHAYTNLSFKLAKHPLINENNIPKERIVVNFYDCPSCSKISIGVKGVGDDVKGISIPIFPTNLSKQFPSYVPTPIREDYEEAYAIVNLSPKASATLSRRCLQGMIRDFWGISRKTLAQEIDALETLIPPTQWKVLNGLRRIGNIGAHMEQDINTIVEIDPDEAQKLLKLIELLVEQWYVQRHEQEQLYADIIEMDQEKRQRRSRS